MRSPLQEYFDTLHARLAGLQAGQLASYIPELTHADPNWFGLCVATVDGQVFAYGDAEQPFTIQSISKPFVYGIALADRGWEAVARKVAAWMGENYQQNERGFVHVCRADLGGARSIRS